MSTPTGLVVRGVRRNRERGYYGRDASAALARSIAIVCRNLVCESSPLLFYEAIDPLRGAPVALKVLHGRSPGDLYRLKREFRSLAELRHPALVALHELSVEAGDAHFTMDLIQGRDLLSYLRDAISGESVLRARAGDRAAASACVAAPLSAA
jgi:hypothetical protein